MDPAGVPAGARGKVREEPRDPRVHGTGAPEGISPGVNKGRGAVLMEQIKILVGLQEIMIQARMVETEKRKVPLEVADLKALFEEREGRGRNGRTPPGRTKCWRFLRATRRRRSAWPSSRRKSRR